MADMIRAVWTNNRTLAVSVVTAVSTMLAGLVWRTFFMDRHTVRLITRLAPDYDQRMSTRKRRLFDGLHQLKTARRDGVITILEIGSGSGANFQYYPDGTRIICIEHNRLFEGPLRASAKQRPAVEISQFHVASAENMRDVASSSVDAVVSTKVLCSVADVDKCLQEILRVLKPVSSFTDVTPIIDIVCFSFYSAAALLAMQSAVIATAILSVCLSVRPSVRPSVRHTLVPYPDE